MTHMFIVNVSVFSTFSSVRTRFCCVLVGLHGSIRLHCWGGVGDEVGTILLLQFVSQTGSLPEM